MPQVTRVPFRPGIVKEVTQYANAGGWWDANYMRFRAGFAEPIGGWGQIPVGTVSGAARAIIQWASLAGQTNVGIGTSAKYYILNADTLYDITPSGLAAGNVDASTLGGFGAGPWSGYYGVADPRNVGWGAAIAQPTAGMSPLINQIRVWHHDNFGQDLLLNVRGGSIYYWTANSSNPTLGYSASAKDLRTGFATGSGDAFTSDSNCPALSNGVFVFPVAQAIVAVGCTPLGGSAIDPMQIRWCDAMRPDVWTPSRINSSGGQRLTSGSYIIGYLPTSQETLLWTDTSLYTMRYTGDSYVFGFNVLAKGVSLLGPNAAVSNGASTFFMDTNSFRVYNGGTVQELPCSVKSHVFSRLNRLQAWKAHAAHNRAFSEIWFFYPVGQEVDNYVVYNYADNIWSVGRMSRTAWLDSGRFANPIAVNPQGKIYWHEYGTDADTGPLQPYIESTDFDINGGDQYVFLQKVIPDIEFSGTAANQMVTVDLMRRNSGNDQKIVQRSLPLLPDTEYLYGRVRGRRLSVRFSSSLTGCDWKLGQTEAEIMPNGRR